MIFIIHFTVFVSVFLSEIFYSAILYIGIKSLHFSISLHSTLSLASTILFFSISVVKIMLSFWINRLSMHLLEREGPNNSSLMINIITNN